MRQMFCVTHAAISLPEATTVSDSNTPAMSHSGMITTAGLTSIVSHSPWVEMTTSPTTIVSSGIIEPSGVAVDGSGNVYIADALTISQWSPSTNLVAPLHSVGHNIPYGVAVDRSGNVYFTDQRDDAIKEWSPSTQTITNEIYLNSQPMGIAVDRSGNVYMAISEDNMIQKWSASTKTVTNLIVSGLDQPNGVAVDGSGNLYIADTAHRAIKEWSASTRTLTTLVASGLTQPSGVAVDRAGNLYVADEGGNAIEEWSASTKIVTTLATSTLPLGVAVDGAGDVYFTSRDGKIDELTHVSSQPPTITAPAAVSVTQNGSLAFVGGNKIGVADVSGIDEKMTLSVSHGTLTVPLPTFRSRPLVAVTGNGTGSMTLTGQLGNLKTVLAGLKYKPTWGYHGADTLNLSDRDVTDNLTGSTQVAITVS